MVEQLHLQIDICRRFDCMACLIKQPNSFQWADCKHVSGLNEKPAVALVVINSVELFFTNKAVQGLVFQFKES